MRPPSGMLLMKAATSLFDHFSLLLLLLHPSITHHLFFLLSAIRKHIKIAMLSTSSNVHSTSEILSRIPCFSSHLSHYLCHHGDSQPAVVPLTLQIRSSSSPQAYCRCLHLLPLSRERCFLNFNCVKDAVELLPVADHLCFQECVQACMEYLAAVPWSRDEEDDIRSMLSSLGLTPFGDLEARLGSPNSLETLRERIRILACNIMNDGAVRSFLERSKGAGDSVGVAVTTMHLLNELWQSSVKEVMEDNFENESVKKWLRLTLEVWDCTDDATPAARKLFLTQAAEVVANSQESGLQYWVAHKRHFSGRDERLLSRILKDILEGVGEGRILLSNAARFSLAKNWVRTITEVLHEERARVALNKIIKTLPIWEEEVDRWIADTLPSEPQLSEAFETAACYRQLEPF